MKRNEMEMAISVSVVVVVHVAFSVVVSSTMACYYYGTRGTRARICFFLICAIISVKIHEWLTCTRKNYFEFSNIKCQNN